VDLAALDPGGEFNGAGCLRRQLIVGTRRNAAAKALTADELIPEPSRLLQLLTAVQNCGAGRPKFAALGK
jgi:hypothetical protein